MHSWKSSVSLVRKTCFNCYFPGEHWTWVYGICNRSAECYTTPCRRDGDSRPPWMASRSQRSQRRTTFYHVMRHHFFSHLPLVRLHHVRSLRYYEQCRDEHKTYIFRIMSEEGLTGSDSADGVKAFNKLHQVTSRTAWTTPANRTQTRPLGGPGDNEADSTTDLSEAHASGN